jgi:hypothetical protein
MEGFIARDNLFLLTDVSVQMKDSRPFIATDWPLMPFIEAATYKGDRRDLQIDPRAKVYNIQGSATTYNCASHESSPPGHNCLKQQMVNLPGTCWRMNNGFWRCNLQGVTSGGWFPNQPPPATY